MEELKNMVRSLQGDVKTLRKEMMEESRQRTKEMEEWRADMDEKVRRWQDGVNEEIRKEREAVQSEREAMKAEREEWKEEKEKLSAWLDETDQLTRKVETLQAAMEKMEEETDRRRKEEKRRGIIIYGAEEDVNDKQAADRVAENLGVQSSTWDVIGRMGKAGGGPRARPLLVRTRTAGEKVAAMKKKANLKGTRIYIDDDLDAKERRMQRELRDAVAAARREGKRAKMAYGRMWINEVGYVWTAEGVIRSEQRAKDDQDTNGRRLKQGETQKWKG